MEIKYTAGSSQLGDVVVAATDKGLCAVSIVNADSDVEASLTRRFPKASLVRDDNDLKPALDFVLAKIAGRRTSDDIPLDLQGTDFQREVWNQLLAIPAGATRTYGDIATAINRPRATRAVAQACGANPVAVIVPCHRVVMSDGSIGGYSGLPGVKKALLEAEGVDRFATSESAPAQS